MSHASIGKCQCMFIYVWLSALPAVVLATSSVLSRAPWCPLSGLRTCTLLPSPPLPTLTAMSPALLAPSHASSGTARTQPTGKLAHGARWNINHLLGIEKSSPANQHLNKTFRWLVHFPLLLINLICGFGFGCSLFTYCFVTVFGNYFVRVYVCMGLPVLTDLWGRSYGAQSGVCDLQRPTVQTLPSIWKTWVSSCMSRQRVWVKAFLSSPVKYIKHLKVSTILSSFLMHTVLTANMECAG